MFVRSLVLVAVVAAGLAAPPAPANAGPPPAATVQAAALVPLSAHASAKPRATVSAAAVVLGSGKVRVSVTSTANKVKLTYRTAKDKKRTTTIKIRKGAGARTLAKGTKKIYAQAKPTKKLRASTKVAVTIPPVAGAGAASAMLVPPVDGLADMAWAPTGSYIAYNSAGGLRVVDSLTGAITTVVPEQVSRFSWLASGTSLAFRQGSSQGWFVKDLVTGSTQQLVIDASEPDRYGALSTVIWSKDGAKLAFSWSKLCGQEGSQSVHAGGAAVKDLNTGTVTAVSETQCGIGDLGVPSTPRQFSVDGTSLLLVPMVANINGTPTSSRVVNLQTGASTTIAQPSGYLSPDGNRILVESLNKAASGSTASADLILTDLPSGQSSAALHSGIYGDELFAGAWSPRGDEVAFDFYKWERGAVPFASQHTLTGFGGFIKNLTTGTIRMVSTDEHGNPCRNVNSAAYSTWSPDGTKVAFRCELTGGFAIYVKSVR